MDLESYDIYVPIGILIAVIHMIIVGLGTIYRDGE